MERRILISEMLKCIAQKQILELMKCSRWRDRSRIVGRRTRTGQCGNMRVVGHRIKRISSDITGMTKAHVCGHAPLLCPQMPASCPQAFRARAECHCCPAPLCSWTPPPLVAPTIATFSQTPPHRREGRGAQKHRLLFPPSPRPPDTLRERASVCSAPAQLSTTYKN